ncbi:hypothetical protein UFOVP1196_80 [uncultured Caudovirales phage]|uniref:Uncharacterized protein n=1 Tax=uncultured Caudovirales phage TaxID=2100421 RepID=A0A6J5R1R1_9CAUD|nr:hypothetical protein UFOVP1196_80 [uncultured Caudovirales phage]
MAWTTPRTWVSGELVTASMMNTHVRDNLNALTQATSTITTTGTQTALALPTGRGDLVIFCNNASTLTLQGITAGSDGQMLTLHCKNARVYLSSEHASASAANRLTLMGTTVGLVLNHTIVLQYDSTGARWRQVALNQPWAEYNNGNSGTAMTLFFSEYGQVQKLTRNGNCTFTLSAPPIPGTYIVKFIHDGTGTAYTATFSPTVKWPSGSAFSFTNTAGAIDILTFYWDGTSYYVVGQAAFA